MITEFINEYGTMILYTIVTAIAGYVGLWAKKLITKFANDKTKREIVKTCVKAVEQLYYDLDGEEKFDEAVCAAVEMLDERGITVTELEIKMLVEAAVCEFNEKVKTS